MTREELLKSPEYWTLEIQMELFNVINNFMKSNNLNRKDLADKLGFSKGYISQILNGEFDHRISKFVELALAVGKVPRIEFDDIEKIFELDELDLLHDKKYGKIEETIELKFDFNSGITTSNTPKSELTIPYNESKSNYFQINQNLNNETNKKEKYEFA